MSEELSTVAPGVFEMLRSFSAEELTPSPEEAVDGMRAAFVRSFNLALGPGAGGLAARAWPAWRRSLLAGDGVAAAEESAYAEASAALNTELRFAIYLWITERRLRRGARWGTAAATVCS